MTTHVDANESARVRTMTRAEVDLATAWALAEGWNPGLWDADSFYAADPEGFLIAEANGSPVGCVSCVNYDDAFCFIGFFIVRPEHRGKGYGMTLWRAAMARVGKRIAGLDGVVAQQDNYRKSGFVFAYNNIRYECEGRSRDYADLVPLAEIHMDALVAYDARFFPVQRRTFLEQWTVMPDAVGFAARHGGALVGYGLIRRCRSGWKIGPLFADSPDVADRLYRALAAQAPGAPVYLDVPQVNAHAVALAERYGMRETFQTARMYLHGTPQVCLDGVFGVTSFELG